VSDELENLVTKGLFDHIEGGWFRYSVDPQWKIPHFEKMLYDQVVLLELCAVAYEGNRELCRYAIDKTAYWLRERMALPNGLYGSATDADTEEGEGTYYLIDNAESADKVELFRMVECGRHEGAYHPWINMELLDRSENESEKLISEEKRMRRSRALPPLDEKAVFSWNCYLAYALHRCANAAGDESVAGQARDLENALERAAKSGIRHVFYADGSAKGNGYLEDWASWLLLRTATGNAESAEIERIVAEIEERFYQSGRIWHTLEKRFENQNMWQDTPFPSGGSMLLLALASSGKKETPLLDALKTNLAEIAVEHPPYFSNWLRGYIASR
jgi:uncharacterized protein YyaL (SSP411 family)